MTISNRLKLRPVGFNIFIRIRKMTCNMHIINTDPSRVTNINIKENTKYYGKNGSEKYKYLGMVMNWNESITILASSLRSVVTKPYSNLNLKKHSQELFTQFPKNPHFSTVQTSIHNPLSLSKHLQKNFACSFFSFTARNFRRNYWTFQNQKYYNKTQRRSSLQSSAGV